MNQTLSEALQAPAAQTPATPKARIPELDGLRGIAVLLVVLYHFIVPFGPYSNRVANAFYNAFRIGWAGVDLFFVLSGFLIGGILLDARESNTYFKTFYLRRIFRIFPIYYVWISIFFVLLAALSTRVAQQIGVLRGGWSTVPVFAFYLQNTWKLNPAMRSPWLAHLWSLAVEEQFYLVIPCLIRFLPRRRLVHLLVATVFLTPLTRVVLVCYFPHHAMAQYRLTICRADALAAGVLLAILWRDKDALSWILNHRKAMYAVFASLSLGVVGLATFHPGQFGLLSVIGYSCIDLFFTNLLLWTLLAPKGTWGAFCRWSFLTGLGGVSYCVYIIHLAANAVCHAVLARSGGGISTWPGLLATIVAAGVTWLVATISWRFFESPLLRRGHAFRY
ncbi:MAG: acyltransferase family protein [Candidatus Acidiferrales bacterium]